MQSSPCRTTHVNQRDAGPDRVQAALDQSGQPARVAPNRLNQEFSVDAPNQTWVGDITYIRTDEGFLYLAVVLDLFSPRVEGWSMQLTMSRDLVMQALLSALWRRRPTGTVLVHSDQGSQYGSQD